MDVFLLYLVVGMAVGFLSGLMGVGGGIILVPSLLFIFTYSGFSNEILMHMAIGTSLAAIVATTLISLWIHIRQGAMIGSIFKKMAGGIFIGTIVGVILTGFIDSHQLSMFFGIFLVFVALKMFFSPQVEASENHPNQIIMSGVSLCVGILSGMLGLGGGILIIPFLTHINVNVKNMLAISLACGSLAAIVGALTSIAISYQRPDLPAYSTGYVYWPAVAGISAGSIFFSKLGAYLAIHVPKKMLNISFGVLILFVAYKMIFS